MIENQRRGIVSFASRLTQGGGHEVTCQTSDVGSQFRRFSEMRVCNIHSKSRVSFNFQGFVRIL